MGNIEDVVVDADGRAVKEKWYKSLGRGIKKAAKVTGEFIMDNKKEITSAVMVSIIGGSMIVAQNKKLKAAKLKEYSKSVDLWHDECKIWDPSNGFFVYTKRPLSGNEKEIFSHERLNGKTSTEILSSMGLIFEGDPVTNFKKK